MVEPGEAILKGTRGLGGVGSANLAVSWGGCCGVCDWPCCGAGCCSGVMAACCCAGAGCCVGAGRPGLRGSISLCSCSLLGTGVRDCAMRFLSEMMLVLGGAFSFNWSGGSSRNVV